MSATSINSYERICSDLTVLASLDSKPGQERKLVYSLDRGLDSEPSGYYRSFASGVNWLASYVRLDSGYTREITDLTPIIGNIKTYCSESTASLDKEKLQMLAIKISLATIGLTDHCKKYSGQQAKEEIIARAISGLEESYLLVITQQERLEQIEAQEQAQAKEATVVECNHSESLMNAARDVVKAMQGLIDQVARKVEPTDQTGSNQ
jgi:hypothetical protein